MININNLSKGINRYREQIIPEIQPHIILEVSNTQPLCIIFTQEIRTILRQQTQGWK